MGLLKRRFPFFETTKSSSKPSTNPYSNPVVYTGGSAGCRLLLGGKCRFAAEIRWCHCDKFRTRNGNHHSTESELSSVLVWKQSDHVQRDFLRRPVELGADRLFSEESTCHFELSVACFLWGQILIEDEKARDWLRIGFENPFGVFFAVVIGVISRINSRSQDFFLISFDLSCQWLRR